jgi:pre-rRNA-processing protein TSR1
MVINPIFSASGNSPNDVHKFDRYLHPGRNAIASFIGPLTWGSVPVLYFERVVPTDPEEFPLPSLHLIATGTSLAPSTNRVVTKRILLTGHPYKIHKKLVTVRYMFFNSEDVAWFKALQLWTKRGRSGFIRESLGTHGYFKVRDSPAYGDMDIVNKTSGDFRRENQSSGCSCLLALQAGLAETCSAVSRGIAFFDWTGVFRRLFTLG